MSDAQAHVVHRCDPPPSSDPSIPHPFPSFPGSFSTVKLGVSIKDGTQVAVKIIDKNSIDVKVASLKTEVKILMNVKHPNIVSLLVCELISQFGSVSCNLHRTF